MLCGLGYTKTLIPSWTLSQHLLGGAVGVTTHLVSQNHKSLGDREDLELEGGGHNHDLDG